MTRSETNLPPVVGSAPVRVGSGLLLRAAQRLVEGAGGDAASGERFLAAASAHGIDLSHFYAVLDSEGGPDQVCLAVESTGRTANLYASTPSDQRESEALARAVDAVCESLPRPMLAQALLRRDERALGGSLERARFERIADLAFMRGTMSAGLSAARAMRLSEWPEGAEVRTGATCAAGDLARALERTYIETLDCPALCELRTTADVLESHRSVGLYEPEKWLVVYWRGRAEGAALLSRCPGEGVVEIVYLGLGPDLRGRGLGAVLLRDALERFADQRGSELACAVDLANEPAKRLYRRVGMREVDRRGAFVRAIR